MIKSLGVVPELPDVEVYKRYVDSTALHQRVAAVTVHTPALLDGCSVQALRTALTGTTLEATRRHGKHLFLHLDSGQWMGLHFGMSGSLVYYKPNGPRSDYEYVQVNFENDYRLSLVMPRKLGRVRLLDNPDAFIASHDLGPDALGLDYDTFADRLTGRRGMIKSALMDQTVLAGLGNLYTDEVLFQAGLHPRTKVASLDDALRQTLFDALQEVLTTAIACQADPDQLPADRFLLPHRDGDKKDPYSGAALQTVTVAGRTGYFSPVRQPGPEDPR